jgi:large subunit ribosomal protein L10
MRERSGKGEHMSVESQKAKQAVIDEIKDKMGRAASAVVIDYMGITVAEADAMRRKLRENNVDYKVYKNTLVSRAIDGTDYSELNAALAGPSAFAFSYDDATAPARILNGVMKEYRKMAFKAGIVEGAFYDAAGIQSIAEVPSREELLAKFLGSIQSPVSKFVRTLAAIADEKPADGAAPKESAETPAESVAASEEAAAETPAESVAASEEAAAEAPAESVATSEEAAEVPAEEAGTAAEETESTPESSEQATEPAKEE